MADKPREPREWFALEWKSKPPGYGIGFTFFYSEQELNDGVRFRRRSSLHGCEIETFKVVEISALEKANERIKELELGVVGSTDLIQEKYRLRDALTKATNLISALEGALKEISKTTYGTEWICMDLEEYKSNHEIISRHYFSAQDTAREALKLAEQYRINNTTKGKSDGG